MKKIKSPARHLLIFFLVLTACTTVPIIGRKQLSFLPEDEVLAMSRQQYAEFIRTHPVERGTPSDSLLQRTGKKLSEAVTRFFNENKLSARNKEFSWEFRLIPSQEMNAWCMPGGKIAAYTGILPVTKNEYGLATVLSHEIAHAVARHGNERMSQQLAVQLGGIALAIAISKKPAETRNIYEQAYGITSTLGYILPFSRKHETEADKLGLIFMAMAGYDPNEAIPFWERMKQLSAGSPPPFLSTHPSDDQRIKAIRDYIPTAMKYYRKEGNGKAEATE